MDRPSTFLVIAGDPSGDLHGSGLIRSLKDLRPGARVAAVGGPLMGQAADEFLEDLSSRGLTGFFKPLAALPMFYGLLGRLRAFMAERRPAALVVIDYYGFNRRVLASARAAGIPAYYYISPQVWATRPGRVKSLRGLIRRMFAIFPFETELYRRAGVPCEFVGHPLLDLVPPPRLNGGLKAPLRVGLLPGSRPSEIARHLPVLAGAVSAMRRSFPALEALLFAGRGVPDEAYRAARACGARLVRDADYRERRTLDLALCSSGTATLENALLGVPMVVLYKLAWPTYALARAMIRVEHIAMANLLAGKALVPELVQRDATPERIARAAVSLLSNPDRYQSLRSELSRLRERLGTPGASRRVAAAIIEGLR